MKLTEKIFGTYSQKQLKKIAPLLDKIESLSPKYSAMPEGELANTTRLFRERLSRGEQLDEILPEAYAAVRETADRVLGKRPFRTQLMTGILLHQGRIAEMKTGEGKTLAAALPAYLNALSGAGVHIITVNDYLARRDSEEMGKIYKFLGLSVGIVVHGQRNPDKKAAYAADITYGTNNEFGFDYLRDNMVIYKENMVQRGHVFAIVDEVDSILIDEARTPLIISGEGEKSTDLYDRADKLARGLRKYVIKELDDKQENEDIDADYIVNEKARNVILAHGGVKKAEKFFGIENLSDPDNAAIAHHVNIAIRAYGIMHNDVDYVIKDGRIVIVDAFTGRLMPGRRYSDGLHQAIEAKEGVKIEKENKTLATITFQNYFRMYKKLSGMTGTALTEENEFREIYNLDVIEVPTNLPMIRLDRSDAVYKNQAGKHRAILNQIKECHDRGQPVLVGTVSVDKSEELSKKLKMNGIPHTVLNAKYHEREAEIIAQAGRLGAVTISTNMAGRGTDIKLGGNAEFMAKTELRRRGFDEEIIARCGGKAASDDSAVTEANDLYVQLCEEYKHGITEEAKKICAAGGLFILGTERHESRRIDNQLRGRSGRQGDPGESRFYLSLEDDLLRLFGSDRIAGVISALGLDEDTPIDAKILSNTIESAQKRIEDQNFKRRKHVLTYDDVMNQQRTVIYKQRQDVLDGVDLHERIDGMFVQSIGESVAGYTQSDVADEWNYDGLRNEYMGLLCGEEDFRYSRDDYNTLSRDNLTELLLDRARTLYKTKEELFGADQLREIERVILLQNVDRRWMEHLEAMDDLNGSIGLQAYAQRDPVNEYRLQGADLFDAMVSEIRDGTVRMLLSVMPKKAPVQRVEVARALVEGFEGGRVPRSPASSKPRPVPAVRSEKVGRNELCPCGSGKKYKKCCGMNESTD